MRAPGSSGSTPAYGDPAAIFLPLAERAAADVAGRASRSASGAPRGWPAMPAARRSGASTSASAEADLVRFRCCAQTFPRRSRPCWWEEAPIRSSMSTSPSSPHAHDRTPPPASPPAALRDGPSVDLHGRRRRGQRGRDRSAATSTSSTATSAPSGARSPRRSCCTCGRRRRAPCRPGCCPRRRRGACAAAGFALRAGGLRRRRVGRGRARRRRRRLELVALGAVAVRRGAAVRDRRRLEHERQRRRPAAASAAADREGAAFAPGALTL